jgi:hypothetical protein
MFTVDDALPHIHGNFVKVTNPHLNVPLDTLIIRLTNPLASSAPGVGRQSDGDR